jgi:hypothetical protein
MSTTSAAPASSLRSVVSSGFEKWEKLSDSHSLAQLHAMFWGTSMAEEEEVWRGQQQSTCDEDEEEDIIAGCYALKINNIAIWIPSIWVRVSAFIMGEIN